MNEKRSILALLFVIVLICPATVMGSEMTALDAAGAGAGAGATVVASVPVIELVSVDPDMVTTTHGVTIPLTITADVFAPNGIGWIKCVVISKVEPLYFHGSSLPIVMGIMDKEELSSARYVVTIDILCCQPVENYTVTVTVADKEGNTANGTAMVTVEKALASSVAEVEITPACARIGSAVRGVTYNMAVTLLNSGTETCTFDLMPEGECSNWITVYNEDDPTTPITDVTIASNKKERLIVNCTIPEDVANGEYTAIVSVPSKTTDKRETAHVVAGQYFTVHVTVKGRQNLAARVANITISATEVGMPVETLIEFENEGNVIARPGISISMMKNRTLVECFGKAETGVTPSCNRTITVLSDTTGMEPGEYLAVVIVSLDEATLATVELPFTLFDSGTITREGELNSLSLDGVPQINSSINVVAEFENTCMIALMAMFIGAIYRNDEFEAELESAKTLVAVGETAELMADYNITEPGGYMVTGHVSYDGKNTTEGNVSFTAVVL
jgi:hypothetical protein